MKTIGLVIILCLTISVAAYATSTEPRDPNPVDPPDPLDVPQVLLPQYLGEREQEVGQRLSICSDIIDKATIVDVEQSEHQGRLFIDEVRYSNGSVAAYTYNFEDGGALKSIDINIDGEVLIALSNIAPKPKGNRDIDIQISIIDGQPRDDDGGKGGAGGTAGPRDADPDVVATFRIPHNNIDLNDVATRPINFNVKEIKQALEKAKDSRKEALSTFQANTSPYYEKLAQAMKASADDLAKAGIDLKKEMRSVGDDPACESPECRRAVDEAVRIMREDLTEDVSRSKPVEALLVLEEGLRMDVLKPEMDAYNNRMKEALEYVHSMIDELMTSNVGVYMKSKQEKIDVVIKLPKQEPRHAE